MGLEDLRQHVSVLVSQGKSTYDVWCKYREYAKDGPAALGKDTFFSLFAREYNGAPSLERLIACIPHLAAVLDVSESELHQIGGVLPNEQVLAMSLSESARDLRLALERTEARIASSGLYSAGEALIIDRVIQAKLDYRVEVWPVVRGTDPYQLHTRSWVILQPVEPVSDRQRMRTALVESMSREDRRLYIRNEVISDPLWRSLGLRWRDPVPLEWTAESEPDLFIELPVASRSLRDPLPDAAVLEGSNRILCVGAMWSHAEMMAMLLSGALRWGLHDLRYQGFSSSPLAVLAERRAFSARKLREDTPGYIWAIADASELVHDLRDEIVAASERNLIIWMRGGEGFQREAARAWRKPLEVIRESAIAVEAVVCEINRDYPVVVVDIADSDVIVDKDGDKVDRDLLADNIRYSAGEVMNELVDNMNCYGISEWGTDFVDLQTGRDDRYAMYHRRASRVSWVQPRGLVNR